MSAGKYNFTIEQGAKFTRSFTWKDANGSPINVSGYSFRLMARTGIDDTTTVISLSTGNGITITDGPGGKFQVSMTASQTAALSFQAALYDIEAVPPSGEADAIRLLEGTVNLSREVTR
jgi:hypothetical protein